MADAWRLSLFFLVLTQSLMRSLSLMYFLAKTSADGDRTPFYAYFAGSVAMTLIFNIWVQKKKLSATNVLSSFIALIVPVDLQEFTVRADIIGHARINMYVNISHAWFKVAD